MKQPLLLCYNLQDERWKKICLAAMRFKIRVRLVKPDEYSQTLAALCGMEPPAAAPVKPQIFQDEMLVMANFPSILTAQFLQFFRRQGMRPVALKAVLTPTNSAWDSATLHGELSKERAALEEGGRAAHESLDAKTDK